MLLPDVNPGVKKELNLTVNSPENFNSAGEQKRH
jgi:hypothetical protein